jgi:putative FmdB family regulatory protein
MPLYEYHCPNCNHKFEKLQGMSAAGADCPVCEAPARRAISVFSSVSRGEPSSSPSPLPPMGGGGCCGGSCGCGH